MMKKTIYFLISITTILFISCTENYVLKSNTFDSALVVEATITNELKHHEIKISKTHKLNENSNTFVKGANVKIIGSNGIAYLFEELNEKYISENEFVPENGVSYQLHIQTENGSNYISTPETLTTINQIESVNANVSIQDGQKGVLITVNSFDPNQTSKYYRYIYEETYKVIVPNWSPNKMTITPTDEIILSLRDDPETRVCYVTKNSNEILITDTNNQTEDRVYNFPLRFIFQQDYSIANRYSILVKQYIQNYASYNFYKNLKKFSNNSDLLSQTQPGYFYGNMKSIENPNEKIIGFFDLATVSSKRIFFNYDDIFPGELYPSYFDECLVRDFDINSTDSNNGFSALKNYLNNGRLIYYTGGSPLFKMVKPICGDCTSYASNITPIFWE